MDTISEVFEEIEEYEKENITMIKCEDYKNIPYGCSSCSEYINCPVSDAFEYGNEIGRKYIMQLIENELFMLNASDMSDVNLYKFACKMKYLIGKNYEFL